MIIFDKEDLKNLYATLKNGKCGGILPLSLSSKNFLSLVPTSDNETPNVTNYQSLYIGWFNYRLNAPASFFETEIGIFNLALSSQLVANTAAEPNYVFYLNTQRLFIPYNDGGLPPSSFTDVWDSSIDVTPLAVSDLTVKIYANPVPAPSPVIPDQNILNYYDCEGSFFTIFDSGNSNFVGAYKDYFTFQFNGYKLNAMN